MTNRNIRLMIAGRVQGVFFRAETQQAARRIGVNGWVRNRRNGSVEAVIAADSEKVEEMLAWFRSGGPSLARVDDIEIREIDEPEIFQDFIIRATV